VVGGVSASAGAAQMLARKTGEAQEKTQKSLHHRRRCRWCLDARNEAEVGKPGAFDSADEERSKSAVCAALRKVQKLEVVRCEYVKVYVALVNRWF